MDPSNESRDDAVVESSSLEETIQGIFMTNNIRHDWTLSEVTSIYNLPFNDLLLRAQLLHREYFPANYVQISTLLSVKTGACPEDCKYCAQSVRYDTGVEIEKLSPIEEVRLKAQ